MAVNKRYKTPSTSFAQAAFGGPVNPRAAMTPMPVSGLAFEQPFGQRPFDIRTFDPGASQLVPRTLTSTRMQYIPPSPVGQRASNQPIPAVPQGQRLGLMPATSASPRSLQESALRVSQFSQIPQTFQQRFQERQASGLNQGFTEQDAVNYYNQNYLSRGRGLQPDAGMVAYGPSSSMTPSQVAQQPMQPQAPSLANMSLAAQLEQQRLSGQGMFAGPTPQERAQFGADVQQQIQQNPSPVNQFMDQEMMGGTREGQAMGLRDLQSAFLSQPMQGGMVRGSTADAMRDREQRLAMLGGMNPPRDVGAELTQTRSEQDMAIDEELARQGMTPEKLAEVARLSGRPELMQGGRSARSLLAPGTVIRGMGGGGVPFTIARGQEETSARREARLSSLPARRERDRAAVRDRLANMRLGRRTMAANQLAAQQRAIDMATNPLANPMLVANSPSALSAVFQTQQAQRDLVANAPLRQAQIDQANAEIARNKAETERLNDPNQIEMARNQQLLDSLVGSNDPQSIAMRNNLLRRQQEIMNRMSGQQDSLMPPNVTAPIVPDPQTGAISSSQIRQRMNQLSAYGFQGEDLIRQLEEAGVDRRAIGDMLRGIKDSVLNRFLISEQDMNTIRGLKTTLGIPLYE